MEPGPARRRKLRIPGFLRQRYRVLKGRTFEDPCADVPAAHQEMLLTIGIARAGVSDRKQFKQDDLRAEVFYDWRY